MAKSFRALPGPKGLPLIGSALEYSPKGKYSFERLYLAKKDYFEKYGPIYKEKLGPGVNILQIFDPKEIETVFRNDGRLPQRPPIPITVVAAKRDKFSLGLGSLNGEAWYNLRKAVQKLMMHPRAASVYLSAQNEVANDFLALMRDTITLDGEVPDFYNMILRYTMESIGTVCFNTRLGCMGPDISEGSTADQMLKASTALFQAVQKTTFDFPWYAMFRTKLYEQFVSSKKICNSIALSHIECAMQEVTAGCPMSSASTEEQSDGPNFLRSLVATDQLSPDQVVGITTDLFTAGIDSTANALCFALYNLARNPNKQELLHKELKTVLTDGLSVTHGTIDKLPYLKACVKESFRMNFPIEGGTTRILQKDLVLGGYNIPKKTIIAMNNQTMCLQEAYFERPGEFLPERWLKDGRSNIRSPSSFVMLPFGFGARMCIGRRFAEQEIYLALIKIVHQFRVEYHHEPIGMLNRVFTAPDRPLRLHFTLRNQ